MASKSKIGNFVLGRYNHAAELVIRAIMNQFRTTLTASAFRRNNWSYAHSRYGRFCEVFQFGD